MPRKKNSLNLSTLEQELARIQRDIRRAKSEAKKEARAEDARRKIIAGALALEHAEKNTSSEFGRVMLALLKEYVRENERHLFPDIFPHAEAPALPVDTLKPDKSTQQTHAEKAA